MFTLSSAENINALVSQRRGAAAAIHYSPLSGLGLALGGDFNSATGLLSPWPKSIREELQDETNEWLKEIEYDIFMTDKAERTIKIK